MTVVIVDDDALKIHNIQYVCVLLQVTSVYVSASPNAIDAMFNNKSLTVLQNLKTFYKQQLDIVEKLRKEHIDKRRSQLSKRQFSLFYFPDSLAICYNCRTLASESTLQRLDVRVFMHANISTAPIKKTRKCLRQYVDL